MVNPLDYWSALPKKPVASFRFWQKLPPVVASIAAGFLAVNVWGNSVSKL